jgi:DNA repair protein RadC
MSLESLSNNVSRAGASLTSRAASEGEVPPGVAGVVPRRRLRDLPAEERPRERLVRHGAGALSSRELVAILLGAGTTRGSALQVAEGLLAGGLHGLAGQSLAELVARHGVGRARAARLLAAFELGARTVSERPPDLPSFRTPAESARYLLPRYATRPVETFGLLALDARHRLKREAVVSTGSLTASLVHPREVFQEAVATRAAGLILFHNHPSGDPEPSDEDLRLTHRLVAAGQLMGIEVLDHLVLGAGRFVSLKERGAV